MGWWGGNTYLHVHATLTRSYLHVHATLTRSHLHVHATHARILVFRQLYDLIQFCFPVVQRFFRSV